IGPLAFDRLRHGDQRTDQISVVRVQEQWKQNIEAVLAVYIRAQIGETQLLNSEKVGCRYHKNYEKRGHEKQRVDTVSPYLKQDISQELLYEEHPEGHPVEVGYPEHGIALHLADFRVSDDRLRGARVNLVEADADIRQIAHQQVVHFP